MKKEGGVTAGGWGVLILASPDAFLCSDEPDLRGLKPIYLTAFMRLVSDTSRIESHWLTPPKQMTTSEVAIFLHFSQLQGGGCKLI